MYITLWSTVILAALLILLTLLVVFERRTKKIVSGDANDKVTAKRIRAHGNASEQIPISLILLAGAEYSVGGLVVEIAAVALIIGRFAHALYFARHGTHFYFRQFGMLLTLLAQILSIGTILVALLVGKI